MRLNDYEEQLHEHMKIAQKHADLAKDLADGDNSQLRAAQLALHKMADEAFAQGDVINHRINCMAANLLNPHYRESS